MGPMRSVARERTLKMQEVILRAMAKQITWWQAAEIIGINDRQKRSWPRRLKKVGYNGTWVCVVEDSVRGWWDTTWTGD